MGRSIVLVALALALACVCVLGSEPEEVFTEGEGGNRGEAVVEEDELQTKSSLELQQLESKVLAEVKKTDAQLAELRAQTAELKRERRDIDQAADKLQGARDWEAGEKRKRDQQLEQVKKDVESKQQSIKDMQKNVAELKVTIDQLKTHLGNLTAQRDSVASRFDRPSLSDVLNARAEKWSPMTRNVYLKARDKVLPAIAGVTDGAYAYRQRVRNSSRVLDWIASLLLYGFGVGGVVASYYVYNRVKGHFTVARLLFLGDSFCASFWALMLVCYCFLWVDPLVAIQSRSPNLFFVFQLGALVFYVNLVLLRVLMLASTLSLSALGETLAVVVVGHHYYVRVWQPAMMDAQIHGTAFYYLCYGWLYSAFAINRAGEFAPLKQVRGPSLPPFAALRMAFRRVFASDAPPLGDLESRPDANNDTSHEN